eukprot:1326718-Amorphochlora_amoeboformis.AAC.1
MSSTQSNSSSINGKTALVTGASSGIGRASAVALAKAGAKVVVAARRQDKLKDLVKEIKDFGGDALAVKVDVTSLEDNKAAVKAAVEKFGSLDIIFLNAG